MIFDTLIYKADTISLLKNSREEAVHIEGYVAKNKIKNGKML